jgi:glucose-6-phosphate 1-dehydrogenase
MYRRGGIILSGGVGLKLDNFTIVIFGAAGDLTARKIIPSLVQLDKMSEVTDRFRVIGVDGRDGKYVSIKGDFNDSKTFERLAQEIKRREDKQGMCDNLLFYLATPPSVAPLIIAQLQKVGLHGKAQKCPGWRKIIVEKPFGRNLPSAKKLNDIIAKAFKEDQIYRIDHYLAKETVQSILVFRFGNEIFEPLWNEDHVEYVEITMAEYIGIEHRGAYYEEAGLIRDIIQNHGIQLLAMTAMEAPKNLDANGIRDQKVKIFKSLKCEEFIIGQYEGYTKEPKVAPDSKMETFAALKFSVNTKRWKGIPFYLRAGKGLARKITQIVLHLRHPKTEHFCRTEEHVEVNQIIIQIQPEQKISILFGVKRPGEKLEIEPVYLEFDYQKAFKAEELTPYHRLLLDAMEGDQTLFIRKDGVEESWKIVDNIEKIKERYTPIVYPKGSWGPKESNELLAKDGFKWRLT